MKQLIRPYGDTMNDGKIQLSFTLPIACNPKGEASAKALVESLGIRDVSVVHSEALDDTFSYYIVYGTVANPIDIEHITVETVDQTVMSKDAIEEYIKENFDKELVFIGASTGSDAHTVGIDAIMNMKGFNGHYGLERYQGIKAINLGSQVDNETLLKQALHHHADVILISQTVTQKNIHIKNLTEFIELLEAENLRERFIVVIGGPRIDHSLAKELGFDAGFGPKNYAYDVASFAVQALHFKKKYDV